VKDVVSISIGLWQPPSDTRASIEKRSKWPFGINLSSPEIFYIKRSAPPLSLFLIEYQDTFENQAFSLVLSLDLVTGSGEERWLTD
jgi:hypothetical protein